jgi:hypothetical protein
MWIDLWWYLIGSDLAVQSLNINMFSWFFWFWFFFFSFCVCLHVSLYVSNHFNHCIKLFAPCGPLIGNKKFLFLFYYYRGNTILSCIRINFLLLAKRGGGGSGRDRIVVGFTTTYAISAYSPLMLWVRISNRASCTTLCDKVCQWLVTGGWFSQSPPVSSTNKTDRHDITEILLKVALNTIKQTNNL